MAISTPNTNPNEWELIGEMYEDFDYESIIRYRKPPIVEPTVEQQYDSTIVNNNVNKNTFQFATQNIYKDYQRSVLSPPSVVVYPSGLVQSGNYFEYNKIRVTIQPQNSEVSKIILLVNIDNSGWSIVETFDNGKFDIDYYFINKYITGGADEVEVARPYDYISRRVDVSTVINSRIVDGGLVEDRDIPVVDFETELEYTTVGLEPTGRPTDTFNASYSGFTANGYLMLSYDLTFSNSGGSFRGSRFCYFSHEFFRTDPSGRSLNDPKTHVYFYYNTTSTDTINSICNFINDYKPLLQSNRSGEWVISDLLASVTNSETIRLNFTLSYIGSFGDRLYISKFYVPPSFVAANLPVPVSAEFMSIKSGSDIYVGVELIDKNGVFYPVNNIKQVTIPSRYSLNNDSSTSFNPVETTSYITKLKCKITTSIPSEFVKYRFVYFGSSFDYFVQFPTHTIFGIGELKSLQADQAWEGYNEKYRFLNTTFYDYRKERLNTIAKTNFSIVNDDYVSYINSRNSISGTTILASDFRRISDLYVMNGVNRLKIDVNFAGRDLWSLQNSATLLEVRNNSLAKKDTGISFGTTHDSVSVNSFVDSGLANCVVRNSYLSKDFAELGININCSVEDMLVRDTFNSVVKPTGRTNVFVPNVKEKYNKGKLRSGGNYIDNTQVNNLSRFDYSDYNFVDDQYGGITQMYPVGQNLRIRQERNSSTVYIGNIQSISPDGATQTLQSNKFLGFVDAGSMNVGSKYGDWFKIGSQEFFFDDATKNVYRQSQAGTFTISGKAFTQEGGADYKIHKLITDIALSNNTKNIAFGYDNENDILLLTFLGIENKTIGFHYPTQRWLSYYSFIPENYVSAGVTNYYWEGGKMYKMNKGERKPITYQFTSNGNPSIPKKFRSIEIVGDLVNFNMNCTIPSGSSYRDMYTRSSKITSKENKKYIELPRNMKTSSNTPSVAEKDSGMEMRGQFANFEVAGNLKLTSINVNND